VEKANDGKENEARDYTQSENNEISLSYTKELEVVNSTMWGISWIRTLYIVSYSIRAFIEIWYFQSARRFPTNEQEKEAWEKLVEAQAIRFKRMASRLQGMTIKVGQFLSTRVDILPEIFTKPLESLTDQAKPIPWKKAEQIIRKELGSAVKDAIQVHPEAIASASIAVVYKGQLADGQEVAVKVQRPTIPKLIRADLRAIRIVITLARWYKRTSNWIDWKRLYREVEKTITQELDFRQEMVYAKAFHPLESLFNIKVPIYYSEISTNKVLIMQWIDAAPITDDGFRKKNQIDDADVINRLVRSFIWQIRNGERFHADPHAGNIQIQADGTIVFLDFGMIGQIRNEVRDAMIRFIQSIIIRNQSGMTTALQELGFIREGADIPQLQQALDELLDFFLEHRTDDWNEQMVQTTLAQFRYFVNQQPIQMPAEFAFFGRAMGMLVGIVAHLNPDIDYLDLGKKILPDLKITDEIQVDQIGQWLKKLSGWMPVSAIQSVRSWIDLPNQVQLYLTNKANRETERLRKEKILYRIKYMKQQQVFGLVSFGALAYFVYVGELTEYVLWIPSVYVGYLHVRINSILNKWMKGGHES
jgi:predicted unusual protein kinase regulating ubiquinone biosynthesis (AarF/ABC1/UbiB family)